MAAQSQKIYWSDPEWGARFHAALSRYGLKRLEFARLTGDDKTEISRQATGKGGLPAVLRTARITGMALPHGMLNEHQERALKALERLRAHVELVYDVRELDSARVAQALEACVGMLESFVNGMCATSPAAIVPTRTKKKR